MSRARVLSSSSSILIEAKKEERVKEFLERVQGDQDGLMRPSNAPLLSILEQLGPGVGGMVPDVMRKQHFKWPLGLAHSAKGQNPFENKKRIQAVPYSDVGVSGDESVC